MTQWIENPTGGRARGPIALARAWVEVVVRPRTFFSVGVAPGDQAPGLVFAATVVGVEEAIRFGLVPDAYPIIGDRPLASGALALAFAVVLIAPLLLHLTAALQTVVLMGLAPERAGVSETVQGIAYATAPCVLAGVPIPALRVACTLYGAALLAIGMAEIHDISLSRAVVAIALPGLLVFGYAFRGLAATAAVLGAIA